MDVISTSQPNITCLVPTHNRPHFLRRLLQFYQQFPLPCSYFVVDSSRPDAAAENVAAIEQARRTLNITYRHFDVDMMTKCTRALEQIDSPYVVFCADDDYLLPLAVKHCRDFLEQHPDYSVAQGMMAIVGRPGRPPYASAGYTLDEDQALARCAKLAKYHFTTFYGVCRTKPLLEDFRFTAQHLDYANSHYYPELMFLLLSVIKGKVKVFPEMYSLHESHAACLRKTPKVTNPTLGLKIEQQFRETLSNQFEQLGLSRSQAERRIEKWYGYQLTAAAAGRKTLGMRCRNLLRNIPRYVANLFVTDGVIYRRKLHPSDWLGQEAAWDEALRLMTTHPDGIFQPERSERLVA